MRRVRVTKGLTYSKEGIMKQVTRQMKTQGETEMLCRGESIALTLAPWGWGLGADGKEIDQISFIPGI
jgi:hypothetical protein